MTKFYFFNDTLKFFATELYIQGPVLFHLDTYTSSTENAIKKKTIRKLIFDDNIENYQTLPN